jgi:hypothetical protein
VRGAAGASRGFDLHANVWLSENDRAGLERLCRYVLRPPFAQERLRRRSDGRIVLELKMAWHDGARELVLEPLELLERLAAMTPRPGTNLLICHGLSAARARWRTQVVAYGRLVPEPTASTALQAARPDGVGEKRPPRAWSWAALMRRAFAIDVLACPHCGGRLRLIATLHDAVVIRKILAYLGRSPSGQSPGPAPPESGAAAPARWDVMRADQAGPACRLMAAVRRHRMPLRQTGAVGARGGC